MTEKRTAHIIALLLVCMMMSLYIPTIMAAGERAVAMPLDANVATISGYGVSDVDELFGIYMYGTGATRSIVENVPNESPSAPTNHSDAMIIGIVVGLLAGIGLLLLPIVVVLIKKRR